MNLYFLVGLFFGLWLICAAVCRAVRRRFMTDPDFVSVGGKTLAAMAILLWVAPACFGAWLGKHICVSHGSGGSFPAAYVLFSTAFLIASAIHISLSLRDDRPLLEHMSAYDWKIVRRYLINRTIGFLGIGTFFLSIHQHSLGAMVIGIIPIVAALFYSRIARTPVRRQLRAATPMDDCPLRSEVLSIAAKLGFETCDVYMQAHQMPADVTTTSDFEDAIILRSWSARLRAAAPAIPLFMLQKFETPVVTAVIALRLARGFQPSQQLERFSARVKAPRMVVLAGGVFLVLTVYLLVEFAALRSLGIGLFLTALVVGTAVAGRFLLNLFTRLGRAPVRAYLAWYEAAQHEDRSVEDFLTAIALYQRIANNLLHLETLFVILRKNEDFKNLIVQAELDPDEVWDTVEQRVRQEAGETNMTPDFEPEPGPVQGAVSA